MVTKQLEQVEKRLFFLRGEDEPDDEEIAALEARRDELAEQLTPFRIGDLVRTDHDEQDDASSRVVAVRYYTESLDGSDPEVWDEHVWQPIFYVELELDGERAEFDADEVYLTEH